MTSVFEQVRMSGGTQAFFAEMSQVLSWMKVHDGASDPIHYQLDPVRLVVSAEMRQIFREMRG